MARKVTVAYPEIYKVDRCYGGPEEGGWWWDRHTLTKTFQPREVEPSSSRTVRDGLLKSLDRLANSMNRHECNRPISSCLSNGKYVAMVASTPGEFVTHERPRYE